MATPLETWVEEAATLTRPDRIQWCDGSAAENDKLLAEMTASGVLSKLNEKTNPRSYLHRSNPTDVARTEQVTYICSSTKAQAGPTNNWLSPRAAEEKIKPRFEGAMKGRTMYVLPYVMGPIDSPYSKIGVEVTDSPYVVANMRIMTRMGAAALKRLGSSDDFVPGLHSLGDLLPEHRAICHFPQSRTIWSIGSGYGGNALLGKKCFALRIASSMARDQGWLAEHMLILELEEPGGALTYIAAAFPSACGKTNLAMLISPFESAGYKVRTVGDDIAWMHIGADGRLYAINPEAGFFGVVPGTSTKTNPNALQTITHDTIYTNVAVSPDGIPWWEGLNDSPPAGLIDWKGNVWDRSAPAAHPNSRFTVAASQCPSISPRWEQAEGVPISAIIFGGRRARLAPLVYQSFNWEHGVFVGAGMGSETTAAATGKVGVTRRDPMAMLPFCGYNMGEYFAHWVDMGRRLKHPPAIFHVNWFRRGSDGKFLWPGFGDNLRVILWMLERIRGKAAATETPIGFVPTAKSLNLDGLNLSEAAVGELLEVDNEEWNEEYVEQKSFLSSFGDHLPEEMTMQVDAALARTN